MELYKKFRPKSLDEFIGNESTVSSIKEKLSKKEWPSAVMFRGPPGCGKTTLARIIKQELQCPDVDFFELNAANTRGIDTTREVIQGSDYGSFTGGIKIFLFDEVHMLTREAQNSLLKVLEDTPKKVYFILCTTDPEKVIKTIRSRCTTFTVGLLQSFIILPFLEKICRREGKSVDKDVLREISRACEGSPRQALVLLDQVIDLEPKIAMMAISDARVGEAKILDLIELLLKVNLADKWGQMTVLIKKLEDSEPEQVRVAILNYLAKVLLDRRGGEAKRIGDIMLNFSDQFWGNGRGRLILALFKASNIS